MLLTQALTNKNGTLPSIWTKTIRIATLGSGGQMWEWVQTLTLFAKIQFKLNTLVVVIKTWNSTIKIEIRKWKLILHIGRVWVEAKLCEAFYTTDTYQPNKAEGTVGSSNRIEGGPSGQSQECRVVTITHLCRFAYKFVEERNCEPKGTVGVLNPRHSHGSTAEEAAGGGGSSYLYSLYFWCRSLDWWNPWQSCLWCLWWLLRWTWRSCSRRSFLSLFAQISPTAICFCNYVLLGENFELGFCVWLVIFMGWWLWSFLICAFWVLAWWWWSSCFLLQFFILSNWFLCFFSFDEFASLFMSLIRSPWDDFSETLTNWKLLWF